jgi:hypothetical protein
MTTRVIPTNVHGIVDYVVGAALLEAPTVFRLRDSGSASLIPRIVGGSATGYSMITDYESGAAKVLPMPVHLGLDALSGALLAASPWITGSGKKGLRYFLPHSIIGGAEILLALMTKTKPSYKS